MKRWMTAGAHGREVENPKVDAFLEDIEAICQKHGFSIGHEDGHGNFLIGTYDEFSGYVDGAGVTEAVGSGASSSSLTVPVLGPG